MESKLLIPELEDTIDMTVRRLYRRYAVKRLGTFEDVKQIAYLTVLESRHRFDPERSTNIKGFIYKLIVNRILNELKRSGLIHVPIGERSLSLKSIDKLEKAYVVLNEKFFKNSCTHDQPTHEWDEIYKALNLLPKRYQNILVNLYGLFEHVPMSALALSKILGLSHQRILQLKHQALQKMKERLK